MNKERFSYKNLKCGDGDFLVIAGPCVIEDEGLVLEIAAELKKIKDSLDIQLVFKASYDKANRTSLSSYRGPGIEKGLKILDKVKEKSGLPILTDVHSPQETEHAKETADIIQIPAFLSRQTDLLRAACESGRAVNVKKGQFMSGFDMRYAAEKCYDAAEEGRLLLTERGSSFGYGNLVVDMRNLQIMREYAPVIFDATHSVQLPSAGAGVSAGGREYIPGLVRAAAAMGIDGLFMEVHPSPEKGLSDSATMLELEKLEGVISSALAIHKLGG